MSLSKANFLLAALVACSAVMPANAFVSAPKTQTSRSQLNNDGGGIEEIEFRIYPDGRITEVVRGVKGNNCQSVTESINKALGNVVDSQPTEEMFEEEVMVEQTLENKDGGWEGASSW